MNIQVILQLDQQGKAHEIVSATEAQDTLYNFVNSNLGSKTLHVGELVVLKPYFANLGIDISKIEELEGDSLN